MIRSSPIWWRLLLPARVAAAPLYWAGLNAHRTLYATGVKKRFRPKVPVICIGNLSTGGTGKTPMVIAVVKMLQEMGRTVGVLTRGYKGGGNVVQAVGLRKGDSPKKARVSPSHVGDEPFLMIEKLRDAHILVGADRAASARLAVDELGCDVLVMDDGFQHWPLERDLDVVLIDAAQPARLNRLMPWGNLREPLSALRRAHVAAIAKARDERDRRRAAEQVKRANPDIEIWQVEFQPRELRRVAGGKPIDRNALDGEPVLLVCGLASPENFERTAMELGCRIAGRYFYPDHFSYPDLVIRYLELQAQKAGARALLVTEKDAVKLRTRTTPSAPWTTVAIEPTWLEPSAEKVKNSLESTLGSVKNVKPTQ